MSTTQQSPSPIGRDTLRIDGARKVTGVAQYTSDFNFPGMLYAVPVEATIANGKLLTLDTTAAEKMPGVRAVFHRANIRKIFRSTPAADAVRATYAKEKPNVEAHLEAGEDPDVVFTGYGPVPRLQSHRGDADAAFASATIKRYANYVTPAETHNPLELHSTTAMWEGRMWTLYDSTQGVVNLRGVLAQMFGLNKED